MGGSFAGASVRQRTLAIYCSDCDTLTTRTALLANAGSIGDGNSLSVVDVKYSLTQLLGMQDAVANFLDSRKDKYVGTEVDYSQNAVVVVGPATLSKTLPPAFSELPLIFLVDETVGEEQVQKNDPLGYNLVEGGQAIRPLGFPFGDFTCTSGFAVQSGYGPFILTAGHCIGGNSCGVLGGTWEQGLVPLGVALDCRYQGSVDAAIISTSGFRNNYGAIHYTSSDYIHPVTFAVTTQNLMGQTLCQTGARTTGLSGDLALSSRCATVSSMTFRPSCCGQDGLPWSASFLRVDYASDYGDSGAGVIWPTGYGFGAAGLHKAASGNVHWATQFRHVAFIWSLTLSPY